MVTDTYMKYLAKLRFGCQSAIVGIQVLAQTNKTCSKEDIDVRIEAVNGIIAYLQDVRRHLVYFKNTDQ